MAGMRDVAFVRSPVAHARLKHMSCPRRIPRSLFSPRNDLDRRQADRLGPPAQGFKYSRRAHAGDRQAALSSAKWSRSAWRRRAREAGGYRALRSPWNSTNCRRCPTCSPRASRVRRWSMRSGATMSSSNSADIGAIEEAPDAAIKVTRDYPHRAALHVADGGARRRRLSRCSACATSRSSARRSCRIRADRLVANVLGSSTATSASSRPMSAAASATRACCAARKSRSAGSRCTSSYPVRWLEDRREHLTANANCREHHYAITGYADARRASSLAIDCEAHGRCRRLFVLSVLRVRWRRRRSPASLPGPYDFPAYRCRTCVGRHQQMPDPALSRRRPNRRLLRDRS